MDYEQLKAFTNNEIEPYLQYIEMWQCITALGIKPFKDGNQWSFLYGDNIQEGICGFGDTIDRAAWDFYTNLKSEKLLKESESEDERIRKWIYDIVNNLGEPSDEEAQEELEEMQPLALAWLEKRGESKLPEDLGEYVVELSKQFPEVSFAKLSRIAVRVKNWLEKQGESNPYSGVSFEYNGNIWGMCARDNGVDILLDKQLFKHLEKQGEQKPNANCLLNWSEIDEKMFQSLEGIVEDYWAKAEQEKNEIKIREASDVSYFLKTIQKSPLCWIKCSDGLPNRDGIYLVVTDGRHNDVYDLARYDSIDGWHKASEIIYWMPIPQLNNKSIIEQKPAELSQSEVTKTSDQVQKPAEWSDEDEAGLSDALWAIQQARAIAKDENDMGNLWYAENWLKSIKDRVQQQPKQEWSE